MFDFSKINMQPRCLEYSPPATDDQIAKLEKYCGHVLPENYKTILKAYNGGSPEARYFNVVDDESGTPFQVELAKFYFLNDDKESSGNVWRQIKRYRDFMGPQAIPFADDGLNQVYYMKWVNNPLQVWYLTYLDLDEPETYMVSESFDKMLADLYTEA